MRNHDTIEQLAATVTRALVELFTAITEQEEAATPATPDAAPDFGAWLAQALPKGARLRAVDLWAAWVAGHLDDADTTVQAFAVRLRRAGARPVATVNGARLWWLPGAA